MKRITTFNFLKRSPSFLLLMMSIFYLGFAPNREEILRKEYKLDELEKAVELDPSNYEKLSALAVAYAHFAQVTQIMPQASGMTRKYTKLNKEIRKRIEKLGPPKTWEYYYRRSQEGFSYSKVPKENLEAIDKAIELAPDRPELYGQKHKFLLINKQLKEAVYTFETAISLSEEQGKMNPALALYHRDSNLFDLDCANDEDGMIETLKKIYNNYRNGIPKDEDCQAFLFQPCQKYVFWAIYRYEYKYQSSKNPKTMEFFRELKTDKNYQNFISNLPDKNLDSFVKAQDQLCRKMMTS